MKLEVQEIQGKACLTDFHGMSLTRDKMCHMIKKKHSLIEVRADCKTNDGYVVRLFVVAFTKRVQDAQVKQFTYAQTAQIKRIRKRVQTVLTTEVANGPLRELVSALTVDKIEGQIKTATNRIFPLDPVHIYKAKLIKKPKLDIAKLMEIHDKEGDDGVAVDAAPEDAEAK